MHIQQLNSLQGAGVLELEETLADQSRLHAGTYRTLTRLASPYSGSASIPRQPLVAVGGGRLLKSHAPLKTQNDFKCMPHAFVGTNPFSFSTFQNLVLLITLALNLSWKTLLFPFPKAQPHTSPPGCSTEVWLRPVPPWSPSSAATRGCPPVFPLVSINLWLCFQAVNSIISFLKK